MNDESEKRKYDGNNKSDDYDFKQNKNINDKDERENIDEKKIELSEMKIKPAPESLIKDETGKHDNDLIDKLKELFDTTEYKIN